MGFIYFEKLWFDEVLWFYIYICSLHVTKKKFMFYFPSSYISCIYLIFHSLIEQENISNFLKDSFVLILFEKSKVYDSHSPWPTWLVLDFTVQDAGFCWQVE